MKPSLFQRVTAAVILGTSKAVNKPSTTPTPDSEKEQETKQRSMLSFAEHLVDTYGGEYHGRKFPKEKFIIPLEQMSAEARKERVIEFDERKQQSYARCPSCDTQIYLAPVGSKDNCGECGVMLEIIEGKLERKGHETITYRYFIEIPTPKPKP